MQNRFVTSKEFVVKALGAYLESLVKQQKNAKVMAKKEFDYGTIVQFDDDKGLGLIVGHYDLERTIDPLGRDMYRVYVSENNPYMGTSRSIFRLYDGPLPEHLKNVTWNEIPQVTVKLIETEERLTESLG